MRPIIRFHSIIILFFILYCNQLHAQKQHWKKFETHDFVVQCPHEFELIDLTVDPTRRIYILRALSEKSDSFNIQHIEMGILVDTMIYLGKPVSYKDFDTIAYYWMKWDTTYTSICDMIMFDDDGYNHIHVGTNIRFGKKLKSCSSSRKKKNKSFSFYFQTNENEFEIKSRLGLQIYQTFRLK